MLGNISNDILVWLFVVILFEYLVGRYLFVTILALPKQIYFSYGHRVPGKSVFVGNPLFGNKYYVYSNGLMKNLVFL